MRRQAQALFAVAMLFLFFAFAGTAVAGKGVSFVFGNATTTAGSLGGEFSAPRGVAANESSGDIYVADTSNRRVQRFSSTGAFISAWGFDVIQSGKPGDLGNNVFEVCTVASDCKAGINSVSPAPGGEFSTPLSVAVDQSTGSVYVSDVNYLRVQKFSASGVFESAFGKDVNAAAPGTGTEICTVAADCKTGASGSAGGEFKSSMAGFIAVAPVGAPNAGNVLVSDPANMRVQEFSSAGAFVRTFGWDVVAEGKPNDAGTSFEVCDVTAALPNEAADCTIGVTGAGVGQFALNQVNRIAEAADGRIYTVEPGTNFRVQSFIHTGSTVTAQGTFAPGVLSGTSSVGGGANQPTDVAIGAGGNVLVVKVTRSGAGDPPAEVQERRVFEVSPAGNLVDTHIVNAGITSVNGVGANVSSGAIYLTSQMTAQRTLVLGPPVNLPSATTDPVTTFDQNSATFTGTASTTEFPATAYFEYSTDGVAWVKTASVPVPIGAPVAVEQDVSNLFSGQPYQVRLVTKKEIGAGTFASSPATFTTTSVAPRAGSPSAKDLTVSSATLIGRVRANGPSATYRFEYVTDEAFQASGFATATKVPVPDGDAGSGGVPTYVSEQIAGLQPDTLYWLRLTVSSDKGSATSGTYSFQTQPSPGCANQAVRVQQGAQELPSCRAYEMVTPLDKNNSNVNPIALRRSSTDGNALMFEAGGAFADVEGALLTTPYASRRSTNGWTTEGLNPYQTPNQYAATGVTAGYFMVSDDLQHGVLLASHDPNDRSGDVSNDVKSLYLRTKGGSPEFLRLTPPPLTPQTFSEYPTYLGSSKDMTRIFFETRDRLTPDAPPAGVPEVYEWHDGQVKAIGILPGGEVAPGGALVGAGVKTYNSKTESAISDDGTQVVLAMGAPSQLYLRENGESKPISVSQVPGEAGTPAPNGATYMGSVKKNDRLETIFFVSPDLLTDGAQGDPGATGANELYAYDVASQSLSHLSISRDPANTSGARVTPDLLVASQDGSYVYFEAQNSLLPGAGLGVYVWHDEDLNYVARLRSPAMSESEGENFDISADGRRALFSSHGPAGDSAARIQLYDAPSEQLTCISCTIGNVANADASFTGRPPQGYSGISIQRPALTNLSGDGRRAFFVTPEALAPRDTNNAHYVYEWHEGRVNLVSSGRHPAGAEFLDASPSGRDVFIITRDRLVPGDRDNLLDAYDVRIGGGFLETPPPASCSGDSCQGPPEPSRAWSAPGSNQLDGPGSLKERRKRRCVVPSKNKKKNQTKPARTAKAKSRCGKPRQKKQANRNAGTKSKGGNR